MDLRSVYEQVAKMHGVSMEDVEKDIQEAIVRAYENSIKTEEEKELQDSVPKNGKIPTNEELIDFIVKKVK